LNLVNLSALLKTFPILTFFSKKYHLGAGGHLSFGALGHWSNTPSLQRSPAHPLTCSLSHLLFLILAIVRVPDDI
jgi:hypothetical protein